jgi:hypothetical protein
VVLLATFKAGRCFRASWGRRSSPVFFAGETVDGPEAPPRLNPRNTSRKSAPPPDFRGQLESKQLKGCVQILCNFRQSLVEDPEGYRCSRTNCSVCRHRAILLLTVRRGRPGALPVRQQGCYNERGGKTDDKENEQAAVGLEGINARTQNRKLLQHEPGQGLE